MLLSTPDIVVKEGSYVVEVRPAGTNKGGIASQLIDHYGGGNNIGFALAVGNEGTDEDMFAALHACTAAGKLRPSDVWTVFVDGPEQLESAARHMVSGIPELVDVLGRLASVEDV